MKELTYTGLGALGMYAYNNVLQTVPYIGTKKPKSFTKTKTMKKTTVTRNFDDLPKGLGSQYCHVVANPPIRIMDKRSDHKYSYNYSGVNPGSATGLDSWFTIGNIGTKEQWLTSQGTGQAHFMTSAIKWLDLNPQRQITGSDAYSNQNFTTKTMPRNDRFCLSHGSLVADFTNNTSVGITLDVYVIKHKVSRNRPLLDAIQAFQNESALAVDDQTFPPAAGGIASNWGNQEIIDYAITTEFQERANSMPYWEPTSVKAFNRDYKVLCKKKIIMNAGASHTFYLNAILNQLCIREVLAADTENIRFPKGMVTILCRARGQQVATIGAAPNTFYAASYAPANVTFVANWKLHFKQVKNAPARLYTNTAVQAIRTKTAVTDVKQITTALNGLQNMFPGYV